MTSDTAMIATTVWITVRLAATTTGILIILATPIAWWLAETRSWLRHPIAALVSLPLVLPPTVLGFYLLVALGPQGPFGTIITLFGGNTLAFSFTGLVVGSVVYSLPFVVQPLQNSFELTSKRPLEAAATLGASPLDRFFTVAVPLARPGFFTAATLGFAHTIGEFGVVLMIGGNIPGRTRVLSIAIFDYVEAMDYTKAHMLAGGMLLLSFLMLLLLQIVNKGARGRIL